jgi:hypothetical protein
VRLSLDHLAITAGTLAEGTEATEAALGMALDGGGQHAAMGTANRLIGLGDLYLEVIAIDPAMQAPGRPRWFDLDRFRGRPRLSVLILRTDDLDAVLAAGPPGWGRPMALARGPYRWRMAVPDDGILPFDGVCPALIQWDGDAHPAAALPDRGLRLETVTIRHPTIAALRGLLATALTDPRLRLAAGPPGIAATMSHDARRLVLDGPL